MTKKCWNYDIRGHQSGPLFRASRRSRYLIFGIWKNTQKHDMCKSKIMVFKCPIRSSNISNTVGNLAMNLIRPSKHLEFRIAYFIPAQWELNASLESSQIFTTVCFRRAPSSSYSVWFWVVVRSGGLWKNHLRCDVSHCASCRHSWFTRCL